MSLKKIIDAKNFKEMALATFYYTSGAILGPLLFLGGLGYFLDHKFNAGSKYLIIGVVLAFVTTNILLFKKVGEVNRQMILQAEPRTEVDNKISPMSKTDDGISLTPVSDFQKNNNHNGRPANDRPDNASSGNASLDNNSSDNTSPDKTN